MAIGFFAQLLYFSRQNVSAALPSLVFCLLLTMMPLFMSSAVADVSTACDDVGEAISKRRIEDLDISPRLFALELALDKLNNGSGLGFTMFESTVLDKRKLRNMFVSVAGVFSTILHIMLALHSSDNESLQYGSFTTSAEVYVYTGQTRTYADAEAFCGTLWMELAVVSTIEQAKGIMQMVPRGISVFVGAVRDSNGDFQWRDGHPFTFQEQLGVDVDNLEDNCLTLGFDEADAIGWGTKKHTEVVAAVCSAPSISAIRGAIPTILSLGPLLAQDTGDAAPACALTDMQRATLRRMARSYQCANDTIALGD